MSAHRQFRGRSCVDRRHVRGLGDGGRHKADRSVPHTGCVFSVPLVRSSGHPIPVMPLRIKLVPRFHIWRLRRAVALRPTIYLAERVLVDVSLGCELSQGAVTRCSSVRPDCSEGVSSAAGPNRNFRMTSGSLLRLRSGAKSLSRRSWSPELKTRRRLSLEIGEVTS
jgi:hypothetical protein